MTTRPEDTASTPEGNAQLCPFLQTARQQEQPDAEVLSICSLAPHKACRYQRYRLVPRTKASYTHCTGWMPYRSSISDQVVWVASTDWPDAPPIAPQPDPGVDEIVSAVIRSYFAPWELERAAQLCRSHPGGYSEAVRCLASYARSSCRGYAGPAFWYDTRNGLIRIGTGSVGSTPLATIPLEAWVKRAFPDPTGPHQLALF